MKKTNPKAVRRRIITILYELYLEDPLRMMSPDDIVEDGTLDLEDLAPNCHYLHDRKLIELMVGYNPPMFAATRIAPEGIDLFEDRAAFDRQFPVGLDETALRAPNVIPLLMQLAREADQSSVAGIQREWLLRDITHLRDELRQPERDWRADVILNDLRWLEGFFEGDDTARELPSLGRLKDMLVAWLT